MASLEGSKLNLLSNKNHSFGAAWCTHRLQESNFSLNFAFRIPTGEKSSSMFAIWITERFGPKGPSFGGPLSFKGIGVLFQIKLGNLSVEIRENDDYSLFELSSFSPMFSIIPETSNLNIFISNDENSKLTIILKIDSQNYTIYSNSKHVKISKHWLGVTALNFSEMTSPLYLESVKITDNLAKEAFIESLPYHQKENSLNLIKQLALKVQDENYKPNSSEIVQIVDQMGKTVDFISDEIDLDSIVRKTMIPFSQSWQKRSIKMTKQIKLFSDKIKEELDAAEDQFSVFKEEIDQQIQNFYGNVSDIEEALYYTIVSLEFEYNSKLKDENENLNTGTHVLAIVMFCVVEAFIVLLAIVSIIQDSYENPPKIQPKTKRKRKRKHQIP